MAIKQMERPITVQQSKLLEVLKDSVVHSLENDKPGSVFPAMKAFVEMDGEDITNQAVKDLRVEFARLKDSLADLRVGIVKDGRFVPVDKILCRVRMSNPDAGFFLTSVGIDRDFPASEKVAEFVNDSIGMCDEAIRRGCGFGKYSTGG